MPALFLALASRRARLMVPRKPPPRASRVAIPASTTQRLIARLAAIPLLRRFVPARLAPRRTRQPD